MAVDKSFLNVILVGFAFMAIFTAFQTMGNIEQTIIESIKTDDDSFTGSGYTSLAIIYTVFSTLNWAAPSIISLIGPRLSMFFGAVTYFAFLLIFLIPMTWLLYLASGILGLGAACIWTGQGNYLSLNSTDETISRNSGVFWAMLQVSMFVGNTFVFFQFQGLTHIDSGTRSVVVWVLSAICLVGLILLLLLPKAQKGGEVVVEEHKGPFKAFADAVRLFFTKRMLLLTISFYYTGVSLAFFSGVYGPSIGFTNELGTQAKQLVGMNGIFIGIGEVLSGSLFGIFGQKTSKYGRDPIVCFGFALHAASYVLIFLNLPNNSPFGPTDDKALIETNAIIAMLCSFFLGFGDACFNTQMYTVLAGVYASDSASSFAIFKFVQSIAAAISFFSTDYLMLYVQLGLLMGIGLIGTITFVIVEWAIKKDAKLAAAEGTAV